MALVVVAHPLLRRLFDLVTSPKVHSQAKSELVGDARLRQRIRFDLLFAGLFLLALHGTSSVKVLFILYLNFLLATRLPRASIPIASWVFNLAILFANELCHGYAYTDIARFLSVPPFNPGSTPTAGWGAWLDSYGGLIPRWEILFNITVLRLISFNLDYYWSLDRRAASPVEVGPNLHCVQMLAH